MLDFFGSNSSQPWEKSTNANLCNFSGNIDGISDRAISHQPIMGDVIPDIKNLENLIEKSDDSLILGKSAIAPQSREDLRLKNYNSTSSIDGLTGENLSNNNDGNLAISPIVEQAVRSAQFYLSGLATDTDFNAKMNLAFGNSWNADVANTLVKAFAQGDFSEVPAIEILPSAAINGANGAFASVTNTIYLAKEFVEQNTGNPGAITSVLLEEIGHFIDSKVNVTDAAGDEGDIFSRVVEGKAISADELLELKAENDTATVAFNGENYFLEMNGFSIRGSIGSFYNSNPNIARDLGQPTGNEFQFVSGKWRQNFQRGAIFHSSNGTYSVRGSLGNYYLNIGGQNSQVGLPTGEEVHIGNGNWQQNFEKGFIEWRNNGTGRVIGTPASDWRGEYFNNINLTGRPVFFENLGKSSRGFSRSWGNSSPSLNISNDNFSAKMTAQRYFAPGLYKITTQADDGIRVRIGNQTVVNRWVDQPYTTNSGYFYSNGGDLPVGVEYYERGGGAAINFNITPATKFQDSVNESQQWKATVYNWDSSQRSAPPIDFWQGGINNSKAIGVINLGSNTRSDGKKGINVNWGNGAPNGDGSRLPHDNFAMRAYTWADFDGSPYKFRVMGDDGFQILAKNHATGQWHYITSQNSWDQAYGPQKEINYTLPAGRYDLHFHQYEAGGDAYLNLSWEKAGNAFDIKPVFDSNLRSSAQNVINDAVNTWESIIRNGPTGSPVKDGFQVRIYESNLSGYAGSSYAQNGYAEMDLTKSFFNLSYATQKKVIMHELAHAMGFGQINSSDYGRNTTKIGSSYYFTGSNAKALYGGNVPLMPNFNGAGSGWEHFRENDSKLRYDLMSAETNESYSSNDLKYTLAAFKDMGFNVA